MRTVILLLTCLTLAACAKVGSKAWCEDMEDKPKGDWTANEATAYTKYCVMGLDPEKD